MPITINGSTGIAGIDGSAGTPALQGSDTNTGIAFGTDVILASTGGTERWRVDSSGRLLVGTSTSITQFATNLQIAGASEAGSSQTNIRFSADALSPYIYFAKSRGATVGTNTIVQNGDDLGIIGFYGANGTTYHAAALITGEVDGEPGTAGDTSDMPGRLVFSTTADGASVPTERMRINSSGQVLINTPSALPLTPALSVYALNIETFVGGGLLNHSIGMTRHGGTIPEAGQRMTFARSRGTTAGSVTLVANGDQLGAIDFAGADGTDFGTSAASITCEVDGTPGANDMPGRLVFSTTADGASSPTERMKISSTGQIGFAPAGVEGLGINNSAAAGTTVPNFVGRHSGSTNSIIIWTNGNVVNTNNSYGAISDIKLKENIVDANSQWNDLKALQVRNYNFKEGQTHTQIGLIAQEVELVSPGLVTESPDSDEDGNDLGTVTKSVNYSVLYMKAVKALQEAMERIETLEASNADLLSRVAALEVTP